MAKTTQPMQGISTFQYKIQGDSLQQVRTSGPPGGGGGAVGGPGRPGFGDPTAVPKRPPSSMYSGVSGAGKQAASGSQAINDRWVAASSRDATTSLLLITNYKCIIFNCWLEACFSGRVAFYYNLV